MWKTNRGLIGLVVGLVVGMSVGTAVAAPAAQQVLVDIVSWPQNLNVTLTNPPALPPDADGDTVPDALDAFPLDAEHHVILWSATALFPDAGSGLDVDLQPSAATDVRITAVFAGTRNLQVVYKCDGGSTTTFRAEVASGVPIMLPYRINVACTLPSANLPTWIVGTPLVIVRPNSTDPTLLTIEVIG